jgi:hypothetical protein
MQILRKPRIRLRSVNQHELAVVDRGDDRSAGVLDGGAIARIDLETVDEHLPYCRHVAEESFAWPGESSLEDIAVVRVSV